MKRNHRFLKSLCFNFHLQKIKEVLQIVKMLKTNIMKPHNTKH